MFQSFWPEQLKMDLPFTEMGKTMVKRLEVRRSRGLVLDIPSLRYRLNT
jgi:hypothetical protein